MSKVEQNRINKILDNAWSDDYAKLSEYLVLVDFSDCEEFMKNRLAIHKKNVREAFIELRKCTLYYILSNDNLRDHYEKQMIDAAERLNGETGRLIDYINYIMDKTNKNNAPNTEKKKRGIFNKLLSKLTGGLRNEI